MNKETSTKSAPEYIVAVESGQKLIDVNTWFYGKINYNFVFVNFLFY